MNDTPEKAGGTTEFGRPTDRTRRNRLWEEGSVPPLSHADPKCVSVRTGISHVTPCKRPVSREYGFVLVQRSTSGWGAVFPSGCGRSSIRASGGWVKARQRSEASSPEHRERSDRPRSEVSEVPGSRRRSLSVTCYLRRFPSPASRFLAGRDAKTPESGVKR